MTQIEQSTLTFLSDLKYHNEREWFQKNRKRYDDARKNFESFVQAVIERISEFDPILKGLEVKSCTYRINRDIRFTNDKTIYKTYMGAFIVKGGKKNGDRYAGYYVHVEPGSNSMIAGGAYVPPMPWLTAIREKIDEQGDTFVKILKNKDFLDFFGVIEGEKLKSAPKGYARDNRYIEYLKMKSFLVSKMISDKDITDSKCVDYIVKAARIMKPLNDFLSNY
ncbi:MAG TPA: TIGR02453 family protein [Bacteroidales bacterium]|nr:TIGR02453 family protein [Bacteroidales bacterium]HBZ20431.1 TIGR02453 family protein [Bacteroidales bacterium]